MREEIQLHVYDKSIRKGNVRRRREGMNTESHPVLPPLSLCCHHGSLCFCGCVSERNNAVPQSTEHHTGGGAEKSA